MPSELSGDLKGRKQVRLRMRQNLEITLQSQGGAPSFVVKDPVTLRYFHLDESQRFILGKMDGSLNLEEIRQAFEANHRPRRMSLDELETFARQLLEGNLVFSESQGAAQRIIDLARRQNRQRWLSRLNIFCIKVPLPMARRWLEPCHVAGKILFHYWFLAASIGLILGALGVLATHWQELLARMPSYDGFFTFQTIVLLWIALGVVKMLHELGHALSCQRMGAEVQEIGILFLFFFPTLYCNVSDSWMLQSKWKRMAVSAAGIYVELVIASLATFCWWSSDANTLVHNLSFALMVVCSVNTVLCNANPLMRFDGYYVLSDWLGIPNLAQQATRQIHTRALHWLGVELRQEEAKHPRFLFWFGVSSAVYRWYMTALILYFLAEYLKRHQLAAVGALLVGIGLLTLVGMPIWQFSRWLHQLGRFPQMKTIRIWTAFGAASLLIAGFFFIPIPRKVRGVVLVQVTPEQLQRVVVPETEGFLQELRVRDGQRVRAGEVLAVLANPKLQVKLRLNEAEQALRHEQKQALIAELTTLATVRDDRSADWQQCEHELQSLVQARLSLQEQLDRLVLRAPEAGVVMGLPSLEDQGKWLEKGTELCRIGNGDALRALVLVDAADHPDVQSGASATIRVHGNGSKQNAGFVTGISQVEAKNIPAALSSRVAGDVPAQYDARAQLDKPHGQHYLASVQFSNGDGAIHPGVMGRVKIDAESRTLWWRLRRYLGTTFNWGL